MIYRYKHRSIGGRILGWLQGFAGLLDGLIVVLTFAHYASGFEFKMAARRTLYEIKKEIKT